MLIQRGGEIKGKKKSQHDLGVGVVSKIESRRGRRPPNTCVRIANLVSSGF